ncbi:hypothetical protein TCAL_10866 [Tigriopus californicus]|uniref:EamA domain-containing protein n=1 Tax=Tigriopus californicus TaxID=6832 RepID=A0A553P2X4_TIGCA|nr:hypothetical protein TCAL_10866 [Tigriopus californicus]
MMPLVTPPPSRVARQLSRTSVTRSSSHRYHYEPELSSTNSLGGMAYPHSLLAPSPSMEAVFDTLILASERDRKASMMNNKLFVNGRQKSSRSLLGRHKDSNSSVNSSLLLRSHSMYRQPSCQGLGGKQPNLTHSSSSPQEKWKSFTSCVSAKLCSIPLKKLFFGIILMSLVTGSWVGATHLLKSTYTSLHEEIIFGLTNHSWEGPTNLTTRHHLHYTFDAPLFTTWFCSMGTIFFLPFYLSCQMCCRGNPGISNQTMDTHSKDGNVRARTTPKIGRNGVAMSGANSGNMADGATILRPKRVGVAIILKESIQNLREKGFTFGKFVGRCSLFSLLWMLTNYLYIYSLRILGCTEVMALFATNICFIYLLSWVVLHEQFVGIRIVAVILGNTGIALLAYMDGINQTPTLGAVVLAAAASAGSAIYRVLFKRVMGEVTFCQVAIFFSMIGLCTTTLFWPLMLTLALTGVGKAIKWAISPGKNLNKSELLSGVIIFSETLDWDNLPWFPLIGSLVLSLVANLLANFGIVVTYETFITLGLILAVPACAALDIHWYGATFDGMKLAGIVMICLGFLIVLFPSNWPNCIHSIIRLGRRGQKNREMGRKPLPDLRTGHLGSRLRSPSGRVK